jgi:hypothetical protein
MPANGSDAQSEAQKRPCCGGASRSIYRNLRADPARLGRDAIALVTLEAVHFGVANVIRSAGERDGNYLGMQFASGWGGLA